MRGWLLAAAGAFRTAVDIDIEEPFCVGEVVEDKTRVYFVAKAAEKVHVEIFKNAGITAMGGTEREPVGTMKTGEDVSWTFWQEKSSYVEACITTTVNQPVSFELSHGAEAAEAIEHLERGKVEFSPDLVLNDAYRSLQEYHKQLSLVRAREAKVVEAHEVQVQRLIGCCCFNVVLTVLAAAYQMNHFKTYFRARKVV